METQNRNQVIQEINQLLTGSGFETSGVYHQSCFDMAARKKLLLLLLKVLVNIDSMNEAHVHEIRKVAATFLASPLIVGIKSRNYELEEDVVYDRHGIPAIGIETLKNIVLYDEYPDVLADRGGYFVNINGDILREYRDEYSMSLKDLADLAHVSRETIYKYENGIVRANSETAILLEDILNTKITVDINLFEVPEEKTLQKDEKGDLNEKKNNPVNTKTKDLTKLGFGVVETKKTPFDALAKLENNLDSDTPNFLNGSPLIASLEENRTPKTLHKIAISLKDLSLITNSESFFIINNEKIKESLDGIPVIRSWELKESEDSTEFLKIIKERQDN
ncbi:MAG: transcriptional regulator [Methanobrevibacter sp.]|jgi:putative transcriptional regulator|nr:transcriptional regulator [Methanobrevibacter sp.]